MALINCPECGKEVSDKATTCPNCGCPINSSITDTQDMSALWTDIVSPSTPQANTTPPTVMPAYNIADTPKSSKKKTHSTLSCIACAFAGISFLLPMILIIGLLLSFTGMIIGVVDLCIHEKGKKHIGSWFALIVFIFYLIVFVF